MTRSVHLLDFSLISDVSEVDECENNGYTYFSPHQLSELKSEPNNHVNTSPCVSDISYSSPKQVRFEEPTWWSSSQRQLAETFSPSLDQSDKGPFPVLGRPAFNLDDKAVDLDGLQLKSQRNASIFHVPVKHQPDVFRDVSVDDHLDNCVKWSTSESAVSCINTSQSFRSEHCIKKFTSGHNVSVTPPPLEDRLPRTLAIHPSPTDCTTVPSITGKTRDCLMSSSINSRAGPGKSPQVDETTRNFAQTTMSPPGSIVNVPLNDVRDKCDWSKPSLHRAKHLIYQINKLTERLNKESLSGPCERARKEAARLVEEACAGSSQSNAESLLLNPGLTVNIPDDVCTFNNLMELTVDESEIVRLERERVANQRKHMAQLRKKAAKQKPVFPAPDPLEFFDPNQHVFQSVNLHVRGLPSFLPSAQRASDDSYMAIQERMIADFSRLNP
ncbi:hypothetical protein T265_06114 [Opisthorchis viverrini]|uniref:Uncharacterized protein n=1 Tax=Opisthorchis viverrini TaxID=6198 RepID=A0A074ZTJ1_OPIVI|nr:hypothetical protein T265_06114 [Opisthorchis viverrini]KER26680.1 hypothetical protein T265_06114 [Opisthorchis viverrini]